MQNARLTERAPFMAEVDVLSLGHTTPRRLWGTDVSEDGMFLQTTHPFRVGDRVSLRFGVQVQGTEEHEVHIRAAEVRWVRPFEPVAVDGHLPGIGLQFVSLDPPARAALRRFMVPADRDDITLPERPAPGGRDARFDSGGDLGPLPPPNTSLPPITGSIARAASMTPREITEEMFAVSLPPFSTPPRAPRPDERTSSLPPDDPIDAVFAKGALQQLRSKPPQPTPNRVPRDVTMLPKSSPPRTRSQKPANATTPPQHAVTDPPALEAARHEETFENPLAGWRFEKVIYDDTAGDTAPPAQASAPTAPPALLSTPPQNVAQEEPVAKLGLSFDDERPSERSLLPSMIVEPSVLSMESVPPHDASSGPSPAFEDAFLRGEVALADLPTVSERAPSGRAGHQRAQRATRPRSRALPTAIALIVVGAAVGAGLGLLGKRMAQPKVTPAAPVASSTTPARSLPALVPEALASLAPPQTAPPPQAQPRGVADIEREVPTRAMPEAPPAVKPALAPLVAATPVKAAAKPELKPAPKQEPKQGPKQEAKPGAFTLDIPVGDASVARTFTLSGPNRVVVDLDGGTLPKQSLDGDGKKTKRVRFGTPKPGMARVVVELADGVTASDVAAKVDDGRLALSFR